MRRLTRTALLMALACLMCLSGEYAANAKTKPPVQCTNPSPTGLCIVQVEAPGRGGATTVAASQTHPQACTDLDGQPLACSDPAMGYWYAALDCYLRVESPQPPKSSPLWQGHITGAIYRCSIWPPVATGVADVWFPASPVGVDPATVALQAERLVVLPRPSGHRSPDESLRYQGSPYTYSILWTWYWTDPGTWQTRTATAAAGGVSATVTVTPVALTYTPGDGSGPVSCPGPGRAWTSSDGDGPPTDGGCAYQYTQATATPVTCTQSIDWTVTWSASDGTSGTLPDLVTSTSGLLMVLQVQSVATR